MSGHRSLRETDGRRDAPQTPVTFQDVAACFSQDEWKLLHEWQKDLYRNVMKEIHKAVISLGPVIAASVFSLRAKENDNMYQVNQQDSARRYDTNQSLSDTLLDSDVLFKMTWEENQYSVNTEDRRENNDCLRTDALKMEQDLEANLMEHSYVKGGDCSTNAHTRYSLITPPASFNIKEDGNTYSMDQQRSERRESFVSVTGEPGVTSVFAHNRKQEEETDFQEECELEPRNAMVVTLDPDTASRWLILSEDGRRMRYTERAQTLPDNPKRFTASACVLGREGFSSGRHYWEVQLLQKGGGWRFGAARESVHRKGWVTPSPQEGIWAVEGRCDGQYQALTSPRSPLSLCESPRKLGIYLDYEGGQLSILNADTMEHLYTFTGVCFSERVFPFFSIWGGADLRLV
ncbi:butyrophilin subfamily 3 member A1-like isoform X9 [Pleurodeles waltl]|uniref:butyrophilin subfamily 3 member A1-like isoform X9 n=1 Tax=Pleurodeles waltl TaxID=8319 RepID=UPI0037093B38